MISPAFEKLSDSFPTLGFYKVDVDALADVAAEVGIRGVPTFLFFKSGEKIGTVISADLKKLEAAITLHAESS